MSYPNSSWIHRFSRSVIDPYGGRSQRGTFTNGALNCIIGPLQLAANTFLRHLGEIGMRPTVARDFVSFACGSRDDLGMFRDVLADDEERCLNVMSGQ